MFYKYDINKLIADSSGLVCYYIEKGIDHIYHQNRQAMKGILFFMIGPCDVLEENVFKTGRFVFKIKWMACRLAIHTVFKIKGLACPLCIHITEVLWYQKLKPY